MVFSARLPLRMAACLAAGFLWALLRADIILSRELPASLEGRDITVTGIVSSVPARRQHSTRFEMELDGLVGRHMQATFPRHVLLSWYHKPPRLQVGDRWRLTVRLKRPHGFANPGGFDYESWLFQRHIRATGYVRMDQGNHLNKPSDGSYPVQSLRQTIAERIDENRDSIPKSGLVQALAIGSRHAVDKHDWRVLTATGTSHLLAISGLHIGIVAGLCFWIGRFVWSRTGLSLTLWPARWIGAMMACCGAIGYAALAGFSVPTQRALVMVLVIMVVMLRRRVRPISYILAAALFAVLVIDPLSVLSAGLWLSFFAVALILYLTAGRFGGSGRWMEVGRMHLSLALGLAPLLAIFFHQVPLVAPLANMLAIPVVSFMVVPLVLIGTVTLLPFPSVGVLILKGAGWVSTGLTSALAYLAALPSAQYYVGASSPVALALAAVGILWCLAPRGWPGRPFGVLCLLPLFTASAPALENGEFRLTLLDVGQGLAAVVRTREHVLVYDTGPRFSDTFDAGTAVVVPYLRQLGVSRVQRVVISHANMDHSGGLRSLVAGMPVESVLTPDPGNWPDLSAGSCREGRHWVWDRVRFEVLNGSAGTGRDLNNGSCVLLVSNGAHSVLLTGDIEKTTEKRLVRDYDQRLRADVLIAPHHGSNTSSSTAFIAAVEPRFVLFSTGYRNRYGFPARSVRRRYASWSVRQLATDRSGAISFSFKLTPDMEIPLEYRHTHRRYWQSKYLSSEGVSPGET